MFRVTGQGDVGISPVWRGSLRAVEPPSVLGRIRANELVTPDLARWKGGWVGDFDQTQLAACKTPRGEGCITITHPKYVQGCRNGATVLDPVFTGRYLRVADLRLGPGTSFTAEAVGSPYQGKIWRRDHQTAVAIVGRIGSATGPRMDQCGPPPLEGLPRQR